MSQQSEAKISQGYEPKPKLHVCGNCEHFRRDIVSHEYFGRQIFTEKNPRCFTGGFAVKKMGSCRLFLMRMEAK